MCCGTTVLDPGGAPERPERHPEMPQADSDGHCRTQRTLGKCSHGPQEFGLKPRAVCADSSSVMKTIPFTATDVQIDTAAAKSDLVVDPSRCEGAVLFHQNRRVMMFPAGRPPILARSRAKELATAELYLPPGSAN